MGRDIVQFLGEIVTSSYYAALAHHHGTNGHLILLVSPASLVNSHFHEMAILIIYNHNKSRDMPS